MPVTFLIPGPLRSFSAGQSEVVIDTCPDTLSDALEALWTRCPGIRDRVLTEQAQIREHINVFVGNEDVRYTGGLQTRTPDGAEISIIPAISGGIISRRSTPMNADLWVNRKGKPLPSVVAQKSAVDSAGL